MTTLHPTTVDAERRSAAFPDAYKRMLALDSAVRRGELPAGVRHFVNVRASQINGCAYCIDMHVDEALADGVDPKLLHLLPVWREVDVFDEQERAALAFTEAVTLVSETHVPREVWDAAAAVFSEEELGTLLWATIVINAWNRLAISQRTPPASLGGPAPAEHDAATA
jgi:AhpD family alkylhydroperoxidase